MFTFVQMYLDAYIILRLKYTINAFCIFNPTPLNNSKYFIIVCKFFFWFHIVKLTNIKIKTLIINKKAYLVCLNKWMYHKTIRYFHTYLNYE